MPDTNTPTGTVTQPDPVQEALQRWGKPGDIIAGLPPEQAVAVLAQMFTAIAAELHKLARDESTRRKGQPDWPTWAQLQNTARDAMLRASMCRKLAESFKPSTGR
jgi:hypothetical protein